eukprot:m.142508 g.142508  ORF g.142508 m.142508 type:complete len:301 (-) comp13195_c1_seq1:79-981(-)
MEKKQFQPRQKKATKDQNGQQHKNALAFSVKEKGVCSNLKSNNTTPYTTTATTTNVVNNTPRRSDGGKNTNPFSTTSERKHLNKRGSHHYFCDEEQRINFHHRRRSHYLRNHSYPDNEPNYFDIHHHPNKYVDVNNPQWNNNNRHSTTKSSSKIHHNPHSHQSKKEEVEKEEEEEDKKDKEKEEEKQFNLKGYMQAAPLYDTYYNNTESVMLHTYFLREQMKRNHHHQPLARHLSMEEDCDESERNCDNKKDIHCDDDVKDDLTKKRRPSKDEDGQAPPSPQQPQQPVTPHENNNNNNNM